MAETRTAAKPAAKKTDEPPATPAAAVSANTIPDTVYESADWAVTHGERPAVRNTGDF